jgi:hypothetical protein
MGRDMQSRSEPRRFFRCDLVSAQNWKSAVFFMGLVIKNLPSVQFGAVFELLVDVHSPNGLMLLA